MPYGKTRTLVRTKLKRDVAIARKRNQAGEPSYPPGLGLVESGTRDRSVTEVVTRTRSDARTMEHAAATPPYW